jgi:multiple sugar transport system substrate-binding protein
MADSTALRRASGAGTALAVAFALAGCGSPAPRAADGVVTVTVGGMPPRSQPVDRKFYEAEVREFEKSHPRIRIEPREGFMDPRTFGAKLAGGQLEDVYYVYFTDPAGLIERRQGADITPYVRDVPYLDAVRPQYRKVFSDSGGRLYGLPNGEYSLGLVYNRKLFAEAGLDPDRPPSTWAGVRAAARKISALGDGTVGYADYSRSNQGGWHLTAWLYSLGGEVAVRRGGTWRAAFDSAEGRRALELLHAMRFDDGSMGTRQLLEIADVQQMMGAGRLGMYLAGPDNIPTIVK